MLTRTVVLLCALAAACAQQDAAPGQPAPLETQEVALPPFVEVDACLPVSVLLQPNATQDAAYYVRLKAEPAVLQALSYNVSREGVLRLENSGEFNTSRPIQVTVTMPAGALQAVNHRGTGAELHIAPGFNLSSLTAVSAFGAGRLYADQVVAQEATLLASGTGDVVLAGSFGRVNATSTGTGALYITGANDTVLLDLRGVANAFVQPGRPDTAIEGSAQGINVVQYTDGQCGVQSNFPFLSVCQAVPFFDLPEPQAAWTCGLQVRGNFTCSDEGTAYTSTSNGFVGASGAQGTTPVTTAAPPGVSAFTPSSFQFAGASPAGPGTGVQQQAGSVGPQGTQASSNVAGTGSVSATSVAGPGGARTSTTQGGQTTGFQTGGQQPVGGAGGQPAGAGAAQGAGGGSKSSSSSSSSASSSATASSTAFASASPALSSTSVSTTGGGKASAQASGGQGAAGVVRVGANGASQATATTQDCQALAAELRMPTRGTQ